jgi:uncharacterized membrane protein
VSIHAEAYARAVSTVQWLLMLHVTAAFLLVGGSVAAGIPNILALGASRPSEAASFLRLVRVTLPVIGAGAAGTLGFGIWLWHEQHFALGAGWLWASLISWLIANVLGALGGRHQERSRTLAEELGAAGDTPSAELHALLRDRKGNAMSWLAGAATLGILVLMLWKPGS